ncbi:MAG: DUF4080 domain-containing protein [Eubacteriales bacterium]
MIYFKAVITAINTKYIHTSLSPWYLAAGIKLHGKDEHDIHIHEANIKQDSVDIVRAVLSHSPDAAAFSCYIWNIEKVRDITSEIKRISPSTVIILGGPEVSYNTREVLDTLPQVDYVIAGEGELPLAVLLDCLDEGVDVPDGYGISHRKGGEVIVQSIYKTSLEPPSPYSEDCLRTLKGRIAYLETSRGCPFSCAFCLSGREDHVRFFGMDRVKNDILLLLSSGARVIKLVDRTFNCNPSRACEILEYIIAVCRDTDYLTFHLEVAADLFDEATLSLLEKAPAGLFQIEAGVQSFNERSLHAVDRRTDLSAVCYNLKRIISSGHIHVHTDLIAGLPYEDMDSFASSFERLFSLRPHMLQLGFLKLLHGARIRRDAHDFGYEYSAHPPYEIMSSASISQGELDRLRLAEDALERLYNSRRFLHTVEYVLSVGYTSPLRLFLEAGQAAGDCHGISLDAYTQIILEHFSSVKGVHKERLRDEMVCDRLRTDPSGRLPDCLKRADPMLGKLKRAARTRGAKLGVALLYSGGTRAAIAHYDSFDKVDGRWRLEILNPDEFLI